MSGKQISNTHSHQAEAEKPNPNPNTHSHQAEAEKELLNRSLTELRKSVVTKATAALYGLHCCRYS